MKSTKILIIAALSIAMAGCMSLGVQQMTPAQITATNGMVTCTKLATAYGQGIATTVNADDVRKGATNKSKIVMGPDCTITIEGDVGMATAPVPAAK